jgi:AcrR family transcriptional regulator
MGARNMKPNQEPVGARERSRLETRKRLQGAAARLFSRSGSNNTRTADVAREAGVAVGTVYLHFKDKDALLKAVLDEALSRLRYELARLPDDTEATGPEQVRTRMGALVAFVERSPHHAAVLFDHASLATAPGGEIIDFLVQSQQKGLVEGIAGGYYRGDLHAGLTARAMVGVLVGVLGWWAKHPDEATRQDVEKVLVEMRLEGLGAR